MALLFFPEFPAAFGAFPHGYFLSFPFLKDHFDSIAKAFIDLAAYLPGDTDDVTGRTHFYHLPPVWNAVKSCVYQQAAFAEKLFDVIRNFHIGSIHVFILKYRCCEF